MATTMNEKEIGVPGLVAAWGSGLFDQAYLPELNWPDAWHTFKRLYRADEEVTLARQTYSAWSQDGEILVRGRANPTDDDRAAIDFYKQVLDDIDGGIMRWVGKAMSTVPFLGWGVWEIVPGRRDPEWAPPQQDPWRSEYDDGLIGLRRLGWRDYSTFWEWEVHEETQRPLAFVQSWYGKSTSIPMQNLLHLTFGDPDNPHGLAPLEALYRIERRQHALGIVQGIGFERSAGYLSVNLEKSPSENDLTKIRQAARSIMAAQEGNFGVWPAGVTAAIIDTPFAAAEVLLESLRFLHLKKLQILLAAQWMSISTTARTGTYSAAEDASEMALSVYNAILKSLIEQFNEQVGKRLWSWNKHHFPQAKRPLFVAKEVRKVPTPTAMSQLIAMLAPNMALGPEDWVAIRRMLGFLPLQNPVEVIAVGKDKQPFTTEVEEGVPVDETNESPTVTDEPDDSEPLVEDEVDSEQLARDADALLTYLEQYREQGDEEVQA